MKLKCKTRIWNNSSKHCSCSTEWLTDKINISLNLEFHCQNPKYLRYLDLDLSQVIQKAKQWWLVRNARNQEGHIPLNVLESLGNPEPVDDLPVSWAASNLGTHQQLSVSSRTTYHNCSAFLFLRIGMNVKCGRSLMSCGFKILANAFTLWISTLFTCLQSNSCSNRQTDTLLIPQGKLICYSSIIKSRNVTVYNKQHS